MRSNPEIRLLARENLRGNYWSAVLNIILIRTLALIPIGIYFASAIFIPVFQYSLTGAIFSFLDYGHYGPLFFVMVWFAWFLVFLFFYLLGVGNLWGYLDIHDGERITIGHLGEAFRTQPKKVIGLGIQKNFLIFLWSLLFFIPGLIKTYSYAMAEFLFDDYPESSNQELLFRSESIMYGHKLQLFFQDVYFGLIYGAIVFFIGVVFYRLLYAGVLAVVHRYVPELAYMVEMYLLVLGPMVLIGVISFLISLIEPHRLAARVVFYTELVGE